MGRLIRYTSEEKLEIIHLVENSELSIKQTLEELDVPRSTFYSWCRRYQEEGVEGLNAKSSKRKQFWNQIPDPVREEIVDLALELSYRPSCTRKRLKHPKTHPHQIHFLTVTP